MVFIEDEDFERILEKIALLESERDRAEGLLRSVESARKLQLTEGQLAELCDIKTKLLYSAEKAGRDEEEDDGTIGKGEAGESDVLAGENAIPTGEGGGGLPAVSPESTCSPVDQIVSEVEKLTNWWTDGWKQLIVPPSETERAGGGGKGRPTSQLDLLKREVKDKSEQCERLKREVQIFESRLRVEQKFGEEKVRKAKAERDEARNSAREALKKLANLQVRLQEVQERCGQSEKEMIAARSERAELAAEVVILKEEVKKSEDCTNFWKQKYLQERESRRKTHEQLQQIRGNIRVLCRIRPALVRGEGDAADKVATTIPMPGLIRLNKDRRNMDFEYNSCFGGDSTQEEVFEEISPLIMSFADGYNACIFAYGQTGSGKTFTMQGTRENPGIAPRVLNFLFQHAKQSKEAGVERRIEFSMLEVYNESIKDLLSEESAKTLDICALGPNKLGPNMDRVPGLSKKTVTSVGEIEALIMEGTRNRATTATSMNEHSSRSHAVLSIRYCDANDTEAPAPVLHLVDLAGSERIARSGVQGVHLKEAQAINKSLSALGDVIASLQQKSSHTPYRNSKLTQLLQDSLSGNSKVLMVCNISPEESSASETMSSLNFAKRANQVEAGQAKRVTSGATKAGKPKQQQQANSLNNQLRSPLSNIANVH
ncbi:kinesin [Chloropicon primus]|uniref:Kinesin n=1 Tax=Chloropicon primus TaxID=1764295 RepID=A0A5B8MGR2_9CHLO|nr:kinesin [Chloropicon primus]|eukprot:QDZ19587.1 kinesin [Chloropicon primus]